MKIPDSVLREFHDYSASLEVLRWSLWSRRRYDMEGEEELAYFQLGPGSTPTGWTNVITPGAMAGLHAFCATRLRGTMQGPALGWLSMQSCQDILGFSSIEFQVSDKIMWEGSARDVFTTGVELESWILPSRAYRVLQRWSQRVPARGPAGWPMELVDLVCQMTLDGWLVRATL